MMLIGMALQKLDVFSGRKSAGYYGLIMAVGYLVGLVTNGLETRATINGGFEMSVLFDTWVTYDLGRLGMASGHMGLILLICRTDFIPRTTKTLAAVGRMALTNYIMQTLICITLFNGFGFALFGELQRHQLYYVVFAIWAFQLLVSPIWLHYFKFGPLEWAWRSLTYWKIQPIVSSRDSTRVIA